MRLILIALMIFLYGCSPIEQVTMPELYDNIVLIDNEVVYENVYEILNDEHDTLFVNYNRAFYQAGVGYTYSVDFLYLTNFDLTVEPQMVNIGDNFLGFELVYITLSDIIKRETEIFQFETIATLIGEVKLRGDIVTIFDDSVGGMKTSFHIHKDSMHLIPRSFTLDVAINARTPEVDDRNVSLAPVFELNLRNVMQLLGMSEYEIEQLWQINWDTPFEETPHLVHQDVYLQINRLDLVQVPTTIFSSVEVVAIYQR
jgi:hypothetical protein